MFHGQSLLWTVVQRTDEMVPDYMAEILKKKHQNRKAEEKKTYCLFFSFQNDAACLVHSSKNIFPQDEQTTFNFDDLLHTARGQGASQPRKVDDETREAIAGLSSSGHTQVPE